MTGRIDGEPWGDASTAIIDAPAQALFAPPTEMIEWAHRIGMPLIAVDVWVSRRLRCVLLIDGEQREVKATHTLSDAFELALQRGYHRVYIVHEVSRDEIRGRQVKPISSYQRGK